LSKKGETRNALFPVRKDTESLYDSNSVHNSWGRGGENGITSDTSRVTYVHKADGAAYTAPLSERTDEMSAPEAFLMKRMTGYFSPIGGLSLPFSETSDFLKQKL